MEYWKGDKYFNRDKVILYLSLKSHILLSCLQLKCGFLLSHILQHDDTHAFNYEKCKLLYWCSYVLN